jgi:polysaccharide biosynthesis/export protein
MRGIICWVLILGLFLAVPLGAAEAAEAVLPVKDYLIGAGDVLAISIWKEDALTQDVVVRPDGKIVFPLIGSIVVTGKSPEAVKAELAKKIKSFVPDPILTVSVRQINSLMIYVVGKVNQPGRFVLNTNVNVLQALAMAGGVNSFANEGKIKIFRETPKGTHVYQFDYGDVSKGKHLEQNIGLVRGDVIVVP